MNKEAKLFAEAVKDLVEKGLVTIELVDGVESVVLTAKGWQLAQELNPEAEEYKFL